MDRGSEEEILARLAELVDAGAPLDVNALRAAFPGCDEAIRWALAGLETYLEARRLLAVSAHLPPLLSPGERLADYEIVAAVGRGGMGEMYLARDVPLGREVALKILRPAGTNVANRRRFEREARLLARLKHPSLAEVYRYGEERGIPFLSMRFIHGRSLREWLASFKTEPPRDLERIAVRWITQVADALAHVHANGLVHRDIKPTNIVVEGASEKEPHGGRAVLVDFGLVRVVDSLATTAPSPATLGYAPPEQILGQPTDARADVFSLGATLHDLLASRLSVERERAAAGLEPLEELRPGIDRALAAIVAKAVDPDPRWRYRDGEALRADLENWSVGRAVTVFPSTPLARFRHTLRQEPRKVVKVGMIVVFLSLVLAVGFRLRVASVNAEEFGVAARSGDLAALARAADRIDPWLGSFVLAPDERETLARLRRPDDLLAEAADLVVDGDSLRALRIAAISARTSGLAASRLLSTYLVRALEEDSPTRLDALRLIARVLDERPAESPEDLVECAEARAALNGLWQRELSAEERFLVVTALSACGGIAEAEGLLAWALESPETSETLRLGLCGVERILRRSIACGPPETERLERIESRVAFFFGALIQDRTERDELWTRGFELADATAMLCRTLAFVRRASGGADSAPSSLEALWARAFETGRVPFQQALAVLPAQCASVFRPRLLLAGIVRLLGRDALGGEALPDWQRLGFYWAIGDDAQGLAATSCLAALCVLWQGDPTPLADFRRGALAGASFRLGRTPEDERPDRDARLGAEVDAASGLIEVKQVESDGSLATWDFTRPRVEVAGAAEGATVADCILTETTDRSHAFLKFSSFDSSWVRLRFDLSGASPAPARLELSHVIGARPYHAYAGVVALDVFLDGTFLDSVRLEMNRPVPYELRIAGDLLTPAEHQLEIRSHPATTTTYRLHRASLRQP